MKGKMMKDIRDELKEQDQKMLFGDEKRTFKKYDVHYHIMWLKFVKWKSLKDDNDKISDVKIVPIALNSSQGIHTKIKAIENGKVYDITKQGEKSAYMELASDLNCDDYRMQELTTEQLIFQIRHLSLGEPGTSAYDQFQLNFHKSNINIILKEEGIKFSNRLPRMVELEKILKLADSCSEFFKIEAAIEPKTTRTKNTQHKSRTA